MDSNERYRKQILFSGLGEAGQLRLQSGRVAVLGCGALGSVIAETLVRAGVGAVRLLDRDFVELSNLQRQVLYDEEDIAQKLPKAIAAARQLERINTGIRLEPIVADVTAANILELIRDVDLVLDGTDNFEVRFLLNDAAQETGTPWVHGGCVGSQGQVMAVIPGRPPCLRCLMPEIPPPGASETCDTAGVIGPAVQIVASLQCVAAFKILSGQAELIRPELTIVDVWEGTLRQIKLQSLVGNASCPCCAGGERLWLRGERGSQTTVLCGRNSVQVSAPAGTRLQLTELGERWKLAGEVRSNPFLVSFRPRDSQHELTVFADGRMIVSGTEEAAEARALYARWVGQ
ncbi:ThiF family adenylyltransferase [Planctomicrobium sp. SH664]|uniref:ThiF family adenylyltransferase n=1 Tax=Planctomicrobium sp. SH664 TaxID=3448125 RepID=UPI003F5C8D01